MTHLFSSTTAHRVRHSLGEAAHRADRHLAQAAQASERAHRHIEEALSSGRSRALDAIDDRRRATPLDPWIARLTDSARSWARQGADLASSAGLKAQDSWSRYADATTGYVARQPLRSVLMAAAVGAGLALLIGASRRSRD